MNYNMMTSTSRPPFYWKVPQPEKDYMYENVQRIRKTIAQNRSKGSEPMKAAFIPGVTKNAKYAHVTSRVGEFLRSNAERGDEGAFDSNYRPPKIYSSSSASKIQLPNKFSQNQKSQGQGQQGGRGPGAGNLVTRRLSRSSTDLASMAKKNQGTIVTVSSAPQGQSQGQRPVPSQITVEGPGNYVPRSKRKPRGLQAEDESVYNWRFSESGNNFNNPFTYPPGENSIPNPNNIQHFHRVEYLPCDGICAEETIEDRTGGGADGGGDGHGSGRSSSRTSRGMNTEETRIIEDLQNLEIQPPQMHQQRQQQQRQGAIGSGGVPAGRSQSLERARKNQGVRREFNNWMEEEDLTEEVGGNGDGNYEHYEAGDLGSHVKFQQQNHNHHQNQHQPFSNQRNASTTAVMKSNYAGGGGSGRVSGPSVSTADLPHSLGTVPKYLRQRQEEWKTEADKISAAAAHSADVPAGHVLLSEEERIETLTGLKQKYSMLIDELNRVPIRIDTMRVREYKIQLEQQLQKLERGMAIFSRSRVYVKLPDAGPGAGSGTGHLNSQQHAPSKDFETLMGTEDGSTI